MKVTTKTNFRVEVSPSLHGYFSFKKTKEQIEKMERDACEEIASQIKRHVDDVEGVSVVCDTNHNCSHCGYNWEVSENDKDPEFPKGTPLCCEAAIKEFEEAK
jgi:ppGpp synthetase/RelA/SpoT-type nucleotidyltranferase